jgi:lipoyl(octanoyl) transferase
MESTSASEPISAARAARATEGLVVERPGRVPYARAWERQEALREARIAGEIPDTVLLLEHPDVVTLGRGADESNLVLDERALREAGYELYRVNRGGDVTWHGPGQLVGYPILDLGARGRDVHRYLRDLEGVLIATLGDFGIAARRREGLTGVWLDERRKIASIGIGVRRWVTLHGFALNVCCDLERFDAIVACGLRDVEMTSVQAVAGPIELAQVESRLEARLRSTFA